MTSSSFTPLSASACQFPGEDKCEWRYDGGDPSTGVGGAWICHTCEAFDDERDPPSYGDEY